MVQLNHVNHITIIVSWHIRKLFSCCRNRTNICKHYWRLVYSLFKQWKHRKNDKDVFLYTWKHLVCGRLFFFSKNFNSWEETEGRYYDTSSSFWDWEESFPNTMFQMSLEWFFLNNLKQQCRKIHTAISCYQYQMDVGGDTGVSVVLLILHKDSLFSPFYCLAFTCSNKDRKLCN